MTPSRRRHLERKIWVLGCMMRRNIMAQAWQFWRRHPENILSRARRNEGEAAVPYTGRNQLPAVAVIMPTVARWGGSKGEPKRVTMWAQGVYPADSLTWDDVCELWDNGVYTADHVKIIATLFFDGPELSAVLDVIEDVESDWQPIHMDPGDCDPQMSTSIEIFECFEFEGV